MKQDIQKFIDLLKTDASNRIVIQFDLLSIFETFRRILGKKVLRHIMPERPKMKNCS